MATIQRVSVVDLRGVDIFAGLSDDILEQIASACTHNAYKAGEYCAIQGKATDQILIVNSGKVSVEMRVGVARHSHTVTVKTLTKGQLGAWSAIIPPHILTASLRCLEDTQMIGIKGSDLQRIFVEKPSAESVVMRNLAAIVSSRLRDTYTQLTRLIAELIKEGIKQGK